MILLPNTSPSAALEATDRLHQLLKSTAILEIGQQTVLMTVSIGICSLTANCELEDSLRRADKLLYTAKDQGRNRTVCE